MIRLGMCWHNRNGFTLAEVMVAIGIITVGLLATGALFAVPARMNYMADQRAVAGQLLKNQLNIAKATFLSSSSTPVQDLYKLQTQWSNDRIITANNTNFTRTMIIQDPLSNNAQEQSLTKVTVSISWVDKNGAHTLSGATLLHTQWR